MPETDQSSINVYKTRDLQIASVTTSTATKSFSMAHKMGLININLSAQSAPESVVYDGNTATSLYSYANTNFKPLRMFEGANIPYVHTDDHGYFIAKTETAYTFGTSYKVLNNGSETGAVPQWKITSTTVSTAGNCVTPNINLKFKNYGRLYKYNGSSTPPYTTGSVQTYTPLLTCKYKMECWGANGGNPPNSSTRGKGGYTSGDINWSKDVPLYVYVGGKGVTFALSQAYYDQGRRAEVMDVEVDGAWNGGGPVKNYTCWDSNNGTGGGATDIRMVKCTTNSAWNDFASLKSRIMVAGGGGGMVSPYWAADAGGLEAYTSRHFYSGNYDFQSEGATQQTGFKFGLGGSENMYTGDGTMMSGGTITEEIGGRDRSSGGGGYMGGNMQTFKDLTTRKDLCAASGGSSFISGHAGCVAILNSSTEDAEGNQTLNFRNDANAVAKSTHYSGKVFTNTVMIDGRGYPWTTEVSATKQAMPNPESSSNYTTGYGHIGQGFARITIMPYD